MSKKIPDIKMSSMKGLDALFSTEAERTDSDHPKIYEVALSEIDGFQDHPFHVNYDEDMQLLAESIKENGVLTPILLRIKPEDGRYELVSGHRRKAACELLGLSKIPAEIRDMTREEAVIAMVDANLQRTHILPSERAYAYKMRMEALKRAPGRRPLNNASPLATNSLSGRSDEILAQELGSSKDQIRRYIRLTELIPQLLRKVDEGKIAIRPAVELSYLAQEQQRYVNRALDDSGKGIPHAVAERIRVLDMAEPLSEPDIRQLILAGKTPKDKPMQITLSKEDYARLIPAKYRESNDKGQDSNSYIIAALEFYAKNRSKISEIEI